MNKKLLFISHAAPEDNYLASWLASKLQLLGYEVWVDVEDLRAGSSFWNEIENKMRSESVRFIALVSEKYIEKSRDKNTGVSSEVTLAKSLSKNIDKYILPLKVDGSSYDEFPINMLAIDTIDFSKNWGVGLNNLTTELEEQGIIKEKPNDNALNQWHEYQKVQGKVIEQNEDYGSNWFDITMPKYVYIHHYPHDFSSLYKEIQFPYTFVRDKDYLIGFFPAEVTIAPFEHSERFDIKELIENQNITLSNGEQIKDAPQKIVNLLNRSIREFFYNHENFGVYRGANDKRVCYIRYNEHKSGYISLKPFGKRGRKLYSKKKDLKWRFGLSYIFQLTPFPHLVTHHHLISSNNEGFLDNDAQVKARRSIPSDWYNRDWYERLLAFMFYASDSSEEFILTIPTGNQEILIDLNPIQFRARHSYEEN